MAIRTHYDNLQVARDASTEAIRAAYRELVQQYAANHSPSAEANRRMKTIHNSYSILSNPIQKNKYDQWLLEQEPARAELKKAGNDKPAIPAGELRTQDKPGRAGSAPVLKLVTDQASAQFEAEPAPPRRRWPWYAAAGGLAALAVVWLMSADDASQEPAQSDAVAAVRDAPATPALAAAADDTPALAASTDEDAGAGSTATPGPSRIDGFIGSWRGVNDPDGVRQTLEIKPKSDNSFAFRLDSKAGADIGGITGVARLENGQARFFSREYGCSMVFGLGNGGLSLETRNCRAFYRNKAAFDGRYMRPESIAAARAAAPAARPEAPPVAVADSPAPATPGVLAAPPATAKPAVRLRKYSVSVQDAEGSITQIELLAKDKNAARKIVRDFRGNPKVLKIKELRD